jgi:WD40 repeat protein
VNLKRREIRRFPGHVKHCWSIDFSSNGQQLLTGGTGYLHLWDVATGKQVRQIPAAMPFAERGPSRATVAGSSRRTTGPKRPPSTSNRELLVTLHKDCGLRPDFGLLRDRQYGDRNSPRGD